MERKKRKKLTVEEIIGKWQKQYMSIIFLTVHFQDQDKDGLRLLHFRYALVKKLDMTPENQQKMKDFFGWKLRCLYDITDVRKCISTTGALSGYLKRLVDLGVLKKTSDKKFKNLFTYRITKKSFSKIDLVIRQTRIINQIREHPEFLLSELEQIAKKRLKKDYLLRIKQSDYPEKVKTEFRKISKGLF